MKQPIKTKRKILALGLVLFLSVPRESLQAKSLLQNDLLLPDRALVVNMTPEKNSGETPLRRADIIFFIALPFTILYGTLLTLLLDTSVGLKASVQSGQIYIGKLSGPAFLPKVLDTNVLFIAANAALWSASIAHNDFFENLAERNREVLAERIDELRFHLNFFRTYF